MTERALIRCALAGLLAVGLTACSFHKLRINEGVDFLEPEKLVVGQSTRLQVIQSLGLPPPDFPEELGTRGVSRDYLRYGVFEQRCFTIGFQQVLLITPFRWCAAERVHEIGVEFDQNGILTGITETTRKVPWVPFQSAGPEPLSVRELGR